MTISTTISEDGMDGWEVVEIIDEGAVSYSALQVK